MNERRNGQTLESIYLIWMSEWINENWKKPENINNERMNKWLQKKKLVCSDLYISSKCNTIHASLQYKRLLFLNKFNSTTVIILQAVSFQRFRPTLRTTSPIIYRMSGHHRQSKENSQFPFAIFVATCYSVSKIILLFLFWLKFKVDFWNCMSWPWILGIFIHFIIIIFIFISQNAVSLNKTYFRFGSKIHKKLISHQSASLYHFQWSDIVDLPLN